MLAKLSIALLIAASPALAQDPAPADSGEGASAEAEAPVAYKTKKVCRSIEVVGSSIPRRTCTTKRIPIEPVEEEAEANSGGVKHAQAPKDE
jgi:hypothetical protein